MAENNTLKRDRRRAVRRTSDVPVSSDRRKSARRAQARGEQRYCNRCGTKLNPPGSACPSC